MAFIDAIYGAINTVIDPVFRPFLSLEPFWAIMGISLLVSLIVTLIYKWVTDQEVMKTLKEDMKAMQKELKKLRDQPEKMMKKQKKLMEKNMQYMKHSMKPTLVTFLPIIIIIGWLYAHMGFYPLAPGDEFSVNMYLEDPSLNTTLLLPPGIERRGSINHDEYKEWVLVGEEGEYQLDFEVDGKHYSKEIAISDERKYKEPEKRVGDELVDRIVVPHKKIIVMNLFGWELGWLGSYIIFSIIFSMVLRKVLKLH